MVVPIILFVLGLLLLIKGGDWFVDGATGIARRFHIPELLIGATVVSIGTTLPEVMVSATSALSGHGEMAYGNAIGSIICNTALVAALTVAIRPSTVDRKAIKLPVIFFFIAAVFYAVIAYCFGNFSRPTGIILLAIFVIYMVLSIIQTGKTSQPQNIDNSPEHDDNHEEHSVWHDVLPLIIGAILIAVGADLLVDNGILIAEAIGVPESVIALTFIALGTSLPELVTAITSLVKGHSALSLGNVIGANLFNLVLVSGVATVVSPFSVPNNTQIAGINSSLLIDLPVMLFVMSFLTLPALKRGKLTKAQGFILLSVYLLFCIVQFMI